MNQKLLRIEIIQRGAKVGIQLQELYRVKLHTYFCTPLYIREVIANLKPLPTAV